MATIVTIQSSDSITNSRADLNTNFSNLNTDKIETSVLDTDTALTANSDSKVATQKAVKAYADSLITQSASETVKGATEEATDAEVTAGTATGGTGAKLFITPAKLATHVTNNLSRGTASTAFETSARFTSIVDSGTNSFDTNGLNMDTTATGGRAAGVTFGIGSTSVSLFTGSPIFACSFWLVGTPTAGSSYMGIGLVTKSGTGHTYTTDHAGFKVTTASSINSLYGTQGDGSTETATSALTTFVASDTIECMLKINGSTSIDYFWRKNGGAWSSPTNLTTNMPDTASNRLQFSVSNNSTSTQTTIIMAYASYSR